TGEMRICSLTLKPRSIGPMTSSSGTRTREPAPKRDASARLGAANRTRTMPRLTPSVSRSVAARQPRHLLSRSWAVKVLCHDLRAVSFRLTFLWRSSLELFQNAASPFSRCRNLGFVAGLGSFGAQETEAIGRYPFEVK